MVLVMLQNMMHSSCGTCQLGGKMAQMSLRASSRLSSHLAQQNGAQQTNLNVWLHVYCAAAQMPVPQHVCTTCVPSSSSGAGVLTCTG